MMEQLTNPYFLFAFVAMPVIVVLIGYVAVRLHERSLDRNHRAPGK